MFGILEKTTEIFTKIWAKDNLLKDKGCRGLRPLHPLKGLPLLGPGWKTINWNSSQLVLMYYWSMFLNQVRFLNFQYFYYPIFKHISQASFFMTLTIFWVLSIVKQKKNFVRNFSKPKKNVTLKTPITFFGKVKKRIFSQTYFFMILNIFWTLYLFYIKKNIWNIPK